MFGFVESGDESDDCGLAGAGRSHKCRYGARQRLEIDVEENLLSGFVGKIHIFKNHFADETADGVVTAFVFIFRPQIQDLAGSFETRNRFCELRADGDDLEDGSNEHREKC